MTSTSTPDTRRECKCSLRTKLVGDGCDVCNPAQALEYAKDTIADLKEEVAALRKKLIAAQADAAHWKANHDQMVARKAVLEQRPDLPVDRIPAMREMKRLQTENAALRSTLREVREALQFANDSPNGPIGDTIWMMHRPETLFDFIDAALANPPEQRK